MTLREAAAYLAIGQSTLYRLMASGQVRVVRIASEPGTKRGCTRFRQADLDEFIEQQVVRRGRGNLA